VRRDQRGLTRADLPEELTPDSIRPLPIGVLKRLARPGNGVLDPAEQATFDAALHEVMSATARRVSGQISRSDWADVIRDAGEAQRGPGRRGRPDQVDQHVRRLARRIGQQVGVAEGLAPGVDWSFAQGGEPSSPGASDEPDAAGATDTAAATELPDSGDSPASAVDDTTSDHDGADSETVSDLEDRLTEQVELVQVMSEIAEVSKRTFALEQQRDLQTTRGLFFGFVVSLAVLVAGWSPLVAADDWAERVWILCLTLATCVAAGLVYALVRRWQNHEQTHETE
jgi:hypothetical protein